MHAFIPVTTTRQKPSIDIKRKRNVLQMKIHIEDSYKVLRWFCMEQSDECQKFYIPVAAVCLNVIFQHNIDVIVFMLEFA